MNRLVVTTLTHDTFQAEKLTIFELRSLKSRASCFAFGIVIFELSGTKSHLIMLTFTAHQICFASVDNVEVRRQWMFDESVDKASFLEIYNKLFKHCGLKRTGEPTPEDAHPLHVELPLARSERPRVLIDTENSAVTIEGRYYYKLAFPVNCKAIAAVTVSRTPSPVISFNVNNNREQLTELVHLGH